MTTTVLWLIISLLGVGGLAVVMCWALPWLLGLVIVLKTNKTEGLSDVAKMLQASRGVFFFSIRRGRSDGDRAREHEKVES